MEMRRSAHFNLDPGRRAASFQYCQRIGLGIMHGNGRSIARPGAALPFNPGGKVMKFELRALLEEDR